MSPTKIAISAVRPVDRDRRRRAVLRSVLSALLRAEWFHLADFKHAKYICVTTGTRSILDVPVIAHATGATVIGSPAVCSFLETARRIAADKLLVIDPATSARSRCRAHAVGLKWKHRDINSTRR